MVGVAGRFHCVWLSECVISVGVVVAKQLAECLGGRCGAWCRGWCGWLVWLGDIAV